MITYKKLQNQTEPRYCFCCNCTIFTFGKLNNQQFYKFPLHENNMDHSNVPFLVSGLCNLGPKTSWKPPGKIAWVLATLNV